MTAYLDCDQDFILTPVQSPQPPQNPPASSSSESSLSILIPGVQHNTGQTGIPQPTVGSGNFFKNNVPHILSTTASQLNPILQNQNFNESPQTGIPGMQPVTSNSQYGPFGSLNLPNHVSLMPVMTNQPSSGLSSTSSTTSKNSIRQELEASDINLDLFREDFRILTIQYCGTRNILLFL